MRGRDVIAAAFTDSNALAVVFNCYCYSHLVFGVRQHAVSKHITACGRRLVSGQRPGQKPSCVCVVHVVPLAAEDAPSKPANAKPEQDLSDDMALYEAYLMAAATGDAAEIEPGQLRKTWAMAQGVFLRMLDAETVLLR